MGLLVMPQIWQIDLRQALGKTIKVLTFSIKMDRHNVAMLVYLNRGLRRYHEKPTRVHRRDAWEFQFVLKGEIGLVTVDGPDLLRKRHLWLSRPDFEHGWTGVPGKKAEVAVFHFTHLPAELMSWLPGNRPILGIQIGPDQCREVAQLAEKVARYWRQPLAGRRLCFQQALCQLSLMILEILAGEAIDRPGNPPQKRVAYALKWFGTRIAANPSLEDIAHAVNSSTAQLRRDFHAALHMSPKETFDDMRFKTALDHLQQGEDSIEVVAEKCGFGSISAFSRAFKAKFGQSPRKFLPR